MDQPTSTEKASTEQASTEQNVLKIIEREFQEANRKLERLQQGVDYLDKKIDFKVGSLEDKVNDNIVELREFRVQVKSDMARLIPPEFASDGPQPRFSRRLLGPGRGDALPLPTAAAAG